MKSLFLAQLEQSSSVQLSFAQFALFAILSVIAIGCSKATINDNAMMEKDSMMKDDKMMDHAMMADEGFEMKDGKMVMVNMKTKTETPMEQDAVLDDGTKVMTNGKVIRTNGESFILKEGDSMWMDGIFMSAEEHMSMESKMEASYQGNVLAGTTSKYLEFTKSDYDKALQENKKILLYFYADWCPKCKAEQVHTKGAFNELSDSNLVGFRVNWRDGMDDANEIALAKEFGITSQHTKVILENGQRILKSPETWDKENYLTELA